MELQQAYPIIYQQQNDILAQQYHFDSIVYGAQCAGSFEHKQQATSLRNYTTLIRKTRYCIAIKSFAYKYHGKALFKMCPTLNYCLNEQQQLYFILRYKIRQNSRNFDIGLWKQVSNDLKVACLSKYNDKQEFKKLVWKLSIYQCLLQYDTLKGPKIILTNSAKWQPYVYFNSHNADETIIGVRRKVKQLDLSLYTKADKVQNYTCAIAMQVNSNWNLGFTLVTGNQSAILGFRVQRQSFSTHVPLFKFKIDDLLDKIICSGLTLFGCYALLCACLAPETKQQNNTERIQKQRQLVNLMQKRAQEIYNNELARNGLIIRFAYYGRDSDIQKLAQHDDKGRYFVMNELEVIDVTLVCTFYVKHSSLILPAQSKQNLKGFCDPCHNVECNKQLYIEYELNGKKSSRQFNDSDRVQI